MKPIGPTFAAELAAHGGLLGEHFTWSPTGVIEFFEDTPAAVIEGVQAVYAAHDPSAVLVVVPASISRTQMLLGLAAGGVITDAEAIAAATAGTVPEVIDAVFAQLPPAEALAARVKWAVEPTILRAHPLIAVMIAAGVVTEQQANDLFVLAATK